MLYLKGERIRTIKGLNRDLTGLSMGEGLERVIFP